MFDDIALSTYIESYNDFVSTNKGKIKRPYCKRFEDNMDVKTEEDDGSFDNVLNIVWREDKSKRWKYSTIIHYTSFQTYQIEIKETLKEYHDTGNRETTFFLIIKGSIKTNHFGGVNSGHFYFTDLQMQIKAIEGLNLDSSKLKIDNIAPSVLVELPFPVLSFLNDSIISYRGQAFKPYDPNTSGKVIGFYCPMHQLYIKI